LLPSGAALVRSAIDAYNRRDLDELRVLMTEDVELRPPVSALTGRAYVGHSGLGEWLRDVGAKVLVLSEFIVEGHESRVPLGSELGLICDIREGRIASWLGFFNHAEAVAAVGG